MPGYEIKNGVRNPFFSHKVLELTQVPCFHKKIQSRKFQNNKCI